MKKRLTTMLAFQGQNPVGIDIYKKYITMKDRYLYHGKVDDTHLDYLKTPNVVYEVEDIDKQPINHYDCVINHLTLPTREKISSYIQSLYKIVKPNGFIILTVPNKYPNLECLHWYTKLLPEASTEYASTIPSQEELCNWLGNNGFKIIDIKKPRKELMLKKEVYYNPSGIYDPAWISVDPFWEWVEKKELMRIERILSSLFKQMKIYAYIEESDKDRMKYGQLYFIIAQKTPYRELF
jgi:SAM-dependent methyltransferase